MGNHCPAIDVRAQLERILSSNTLAGSDQLKRLLRLVVERSLNGQSELLKEYNLGLEVFQRPPDYDPKIDPIVRVQARRLRAKLDEYYAGEGAGDVVVIQIPKGGYVPSFGPHSTPQALTQSRPAARLLWVAMAVVAALLVILAIVWKQRLTASLSPDINRSVAVLPMKMFTEGSNRSHIADQIAEVLTTELAKNKQVRVLSRTTASKYRDSKASLPEIARTLGVRWVVEGGVGIEGTRIYVKLRLVDAYTDRKNWADTLDCELSDLVTVNARAAGRIAAAIELQSQRSAPR